MPNSGAVGSSIASVLAVIGGAYAGYRGKQNAQAYEAQKNARETLEKTVIGPAIQSGESQLFDLHEKTLKQHYTKDQIDLMKSMAETQSVENRTKKMTTMLQGLEGGPQAAPAQATPAQPSPMPTGVSASNASSGTPDVLQAMTAPAPQAQQVSGPAQPSGDPRDTAISTLRAQTDAQTKYIAQLEGRGGSQQPTPAPSAAPKILPLQGKKNITLTEGGKMSVNITPPTGQEQAGHEAQAKQQIGWLDSNPHVLRALGPQIRDAIAAGNPQAMKLVDDMQKNPSVMPRVDDLLAADKLPDAQRTEALQRLFGDPNKAAEYEVKHPLSGTMKPADLEQKVREEALAINAKAGASQHYITPQVHDQAVKNVLARESAVRQETSALTLGRMEKNFENRSNTKAILQSSEDMTKKLSEDTVFLSKAQTALKYIAQAGDMIRRPTGVRPIDQQMIQLQGYLQSGKTGEAAALMQGWATDVANLELRLMGSSSRMAATIINKQEQNVPNIGDKPAVFNAKLARLHELFGTQEKYLNTRRKAAIDLLRSDPNTKRAADAMERGLYDVSTGFLKSQREEISNAPAPQVPVLNFGTGEAR